MKITILSQNLAGKDNIHNIENDIITTELKKGPDIYVEFTQEDFREVDSSSSIINSETLTEYKSICTQSLTPYKNKFNIITKVYSKDDKYVRKDSGFVKINKMPGQLGNAVDKLIGVSKGASWVLIGKKDSIENNILFINFHLPIDTGKFSIIKNISLGYNYRKTSMLNSLKQIITEVGSKYDLINITSSNKFINLPIFIGGDLNFRVINEKDQLANFLESTDNQNVFPDFLNPRLHELSNNIGNTCKYITYDKEGCKTERTGKKDCLDTTREPSRCDRFLSNLELNVTTRNFVINSKLDHNAIIVTVEIWNNPISLSTNTLPEGGKRYKKTRSNRKHRTTQRQKVKV